jgi:DNA polymerase-3 subunit gamma/tau
MSYKVLARKWRPGNFSEVVGQQHVLQSLSHALDSDRLHHALLFTGTRGVGKTTIARILAKALNCEKGISSTPCGQCASCLAVDEGRFIDLIEVDAASKTKVDDTRELLDNVQYLPTSGRYKVYLIDEVHMLSKSSFNALLKTLEEPPDHVKFLRSNRSLLKYLRRKISKVMMRRWNCLPVVPMAACVMDSVYLTRP